MNELWKDIEGYEGFYQISNLGRVRSVGRFVNTTGGTRFVKGKIRKNQIATNGYVFVILNKNNSGKLHLVHRLVAMAFIPNPENLPCVNHKDENKLNNCVFVNPDGSVDQEKSNLEWCTNLYNAHYGTGMERMKKAQKSKSVLCYSLDGKLVAKYSSIREASLISGAHQVNISFCCRHKKYETAGGFKWEYA